MMAILLSILSGLTFVLCILLELKYRSPFVLFFLVLFVIFFIPNLIFLNGFAYNSYSKASIIKATLFITLVNSVYLFCRGLANSVFKRRFNWVVTDFEISNLRKIILPALMLSLAGLAIWTIGLFTLKNSFSAIEWTDTLNAGVYSSLGNSLLFAGFGSIVLTYLTKSKFMLLLSLSISILSILLLRSRANLIPTAVPFLLLFLFRNNRVNLKLKYLLYGLIFIFSVFLLQQFRYLGELSNFKTSETGVLVEKSFHQMFDNDHSEFALVNAFYKYVENNNNYPSFGEGNTYRRLFLFFVPTKLFDAMGSDLKPRDFAIDMYAAYYDIPNNELGTMHPTFYGDLYANFGFTKGILFAFLLALLMSYFLEILARSSVNYFFFSLPSICFSIIFLARGAIYNGVFIFLMSSFIYYSFVKQFKFKLRIS